MAEKRSLADELTQLLNPGPSRYDPEEDLETPEVIDKFEEEEDDDIEPSKLRVQNAALLQNDERYAGKKISRKQLHQEKGSDSEDDESNEESEKDSNDDEDSENDYADDDDDDEEEEEEDDDDDDNEENFEGGNDENEQTDDEVTKNIAKLDFTSEIEKGNATRAQLLIWDSLLESRIKLQKLLQLGNQLPQHDIYPQFLEELDIKKAQHESVKTLEKLLHLLVSLQTKLLQKYPDTRRMVLSNQNTDAKNDEEIPSDESENEIEETVETVGSKRKLKFKEYPGFLAKRHADFQEFRNSTIQKWNDRTRLTSGKINMKSFNAFDQTALKQIEQIMTDKNRLLTRCRTKRSVYKILGKNDEGEMDDSLGTDPEIFDDDDFYQQLLRELIEKRGAQTEDPLALSRQWARIQTLRGKMKKNVDTKASKGRRIRYQVHSKLVNFMAPYDENLTNAESRKELLSSLFGQARNRTNNSNCVNFLFGSINN